jgi:hypothetical protein
MRAVPPNRALLLPGASGEAVPTSLRAAAATALRGPYASLRRVSAVEVLRTGVARTSARAAVNRTPPRTILVLERVAVVASHAAVGTMVIVATVILAGIEAAVVVVTTARLAGIGAVVVVPIAGLTYVRAPAVPVLTLATLTAKSPARGRARGKDAVPLVTVVRAAKARAPFAANTAGLALRARSRPPANLTPSRAQMLAAVVQLGLRPRVSDFRRCYLAPGWLPDVK